MLLGELEVGEKFKTSLGDEFLVIESSYGFARSIEFSRNKYRLIMKTDTYQLQVWEKSVVLEELEDEVAGSYYMCFGQ